MNTVEAMPLFKEDTLKELSSERLTRQELSPQNVPFALQKSLVEKALDTMFPEQHREDRTLKRAKEILGDLSDKLTADEIQAVITEIQYLCNSWLDNYERELFNGLTLNELLNNS